MGGCGSETLSDLGVVVTPFTGAWLPCGNTSLVERRQALLGLLLLADCPCCCPVVGELSLGLPVSFSWLFFLSQVITDLCLSLVVLLTWDSFPGCSECPT